MPLPDHLCSPRESGRWKCPDCGRVWEALPDKVERTPRRRVDRSVVAVVMVVAAVPLASFAQSAVLVAALCVVGLAGVAWWFWQTFRK